MRIIDLEKDFQWIAVICQARGIKTIKKEYLPSTGFIVDGNCFCFVYETNSKVCFLEHLVSRPSCKSKIVDDMLEQVIEIQKEKGFELMIAITTNERVLGKIKKFGGKAVDGFCALYKKLK